MHDEGHAGDIAKAVAIAALSALCSALVAWGVEEMKAKTKKTETTKGKKKP